jgi:NAD(P)-dependent dehydrogenase (short-subunit alcohol dehydrogenase family)
MNPTRTALVTGAAIRIGRAIAEALANSGCNVVIHCRRSLAEARALRAELEKTGAKAWVVRGNLDSENSVAQLWYAATKAAGPIDVLVNSAAVFNKDTVGTMSGAAILGEFWPNLFAPMLLTKYFAAQSMTRGDIINLLDRRIASHDPECVPYLLTKKALADFTKTAALALAPRIRVNAIAPGPVLPPPGKPVSHLRDKAGRIPMQRAVAPASVAKAVISLLNMPATTGQILYVDGGQHLLGNDEP